MKVIRTYDVQVPPLFSAERYNLEDAMAEDEVYPELDANLVKYTDEQMASYLASAYDVGNFTEGTTVTEEVQA